MKDILLASEKIFAFLPLSHFATRFYFSSSLFSTFSLFCSPLTIMRVLRGGKLDANQAIFHRSYEICAFRRESTHMRKTAKKFFLVITKVYKSYQERRRASSSAVVCLAFAMRGWRKPTSDYDKKKWMFFDSSPYKKKKNLNPVEFKTGLQIELCRLVSSPTRQNEAASSSSGSAQHGATFAVRVGTIDGVITHHLRAETRRDLAAWARAIVQGCHAAAHSLREYTVRCTWQGKACQLVVNHEEGFALYAAGTRSTAGNGVSPGSPPTPLWRRSFDKLKMSADDGARLLWLDFGGEDGEIELDLESCPKPIVFVLHNFLSAKIHRLGLSA
ncbi:hypothetical protein ACFW04_009871 [Cataglyphis niger]